MAVPSEYGGLGLDAVAITGVLEALGYGCTDNGVLLSVNAHLWSCVPPLLRFGSEEQKQRYLPGICNGTLVPAFAMTEPGAGSDAFSLTTRAVADGEEYVLNGSKTFITNATEADVFIVFATTDPALGSMGVCALLVERGDGGVATGAAMSKMGLGSSPTAEVFLEDCHVPADRMLGRPGIGMAIFNGTMVYERGFILASTVGTMQRQLERAVEYARTREQFGQQIGSFQAVAHRIADMKIRLDASRALIESFAARFDDDDVSAPDAAVVKTFLSEAFVQSSLDLLHVHGGYGYMTEYDVEREVRDALGSRIYSGTSDIQRTLIARSLGL